MINIDYELIARCKIFKNKNHLNEDIKELVEDISEYLSTQMIPDKSQQVARTINVEFCISTKSSIPPILFPLLEDDIISVLQHPNFNNKINEILNKHLSPKISEDPITIEKIDTFLNDIPRTLHGLTSISKHIIGFIHDIIKELSSPSQQASTALWQLHYITNEYRKTQNLDLNYTYKINDMTYNRQGHTMSPEVSGDTLKLIVISSIIILGVSLYLWKKRQPQKQNPDQLFRTNLTVPKPQVKTDKYAIFIIKTKDIESSTAENLYETAVKSSFFDHQKLDINKIEKIKTLESSGDEKTYTLILIKDNEDAFSTIAQGNLSEQGENLLKNKTHSNSSIIRRDNVSRQVLHDLGIQTVTNRSKI
jgi:hypothetical protein